MHRYYKSEVDKKNSDGTFFTFKKPGLLFIYIFCFDIHTKYSVRTNIYHICTCRLSWSCPVDRNRKRETKRKSGAKTIQTLKEIIFHANTVWRVIFFSSFFVPRRRFLFACTSKPFSQSRKSKQRLSTDDGQQWSLPPLRSIKYICIFLFIFFFFSCILCVFQVSGVLQNTGQSLVFRIDKDTKQHVNISGGPLAYRYQFEEIYIHYGIENSLGSEHKIHGYHFPGEVSTLRAKSTPLRIVFVFIRIDGFFAI